MEKGLGTRALLRREMSQKQSKINMSSTISLLLPHQLFDRHEILHPERDIYLVEEHLFFHEFRFHKQKLAFHRASMKSFEQRLKVNGYRVHYINAHQPESDIRKLIPMLSKNGVNQIQYINPTDQWLEKRIRTSLDTSGIDYVEYENPLFINTRQELKEFFKPEKKQFFQTSFYQKQRQKRGILLNVDGTPFGGKWSFDADNRKKYPKNRTPPSVQFPDEDDFWKGAIEYVHLYFPNNPGTLTSSPLYAYTPEASEEWFNEFLHSRFYGFGDFEDAIVKDERILHHGVLTPMLNVGLLAPEHLLTKSIQFGLDSGISINSVEGFVRQIMGWREFIRGMYEVKGTYSRNQNFWGFERSIPDSFYTGTTGIPPIDITIKKVLKTGYCHHIERLMVLGNFMVLCEFHPNEVYRWFMEMFIDAYDWVMVPNVYGMSQFADGGTFATKPYISGSNYLLKMSDYPKGDWQNIWDGLFWRFLHIHRDFFLKNHRLSMLVKSFDRMEPDKQQAHLTAAQHFLDQLN